MVSASQTASGKAPHLLCAVRSCICAFPLPRVVEVMRPLPFEIIEGAPPYVSGLAIVRGRPLLVVNANILLGLAGNCKPTRWVTIRTGERIVALAVDRVLGIKVMKDEVLRGLPPLLMEAVGELVAGLGSIDQELYFTLSDARIIPDSVWAELGGEESQS